MHNESTTDENTDNSGENSDNSLEDSDNSQEDFDNCDTNGDGEVDLDEALAAIEADENEPMSRALTVFNRANFLSNDGI